jgi:hypothetical protein
MLSVARKIVMLIVVTLSVIMLSVVKLNVVAPQAIVKIYIEYLCRCKQKMEETLNGDSWRSLRRYVSLRRRRK